MNRLLAAGIALFVVVIGAYAVVTRLPVSSSGSSGDSWRSGGLSLLKKEDTYTQKRPSTEELLREQKQNDTLSPIQIVQATDEENGEGPMSDLASLLSQLTEGMSQGTASKSGVDFSSIYSFIPQGMITISAQNSVVERTDAEQALFEYGNSVGSYLRGFEDSHADMPTTLKNAREDSASTMKQAMAEKIARDYIALGTELEAMEGVPTEAASLHRAFAKAHQEVGEKMLVVIAAGSSDKLLDAIDGYNTSVERYGKHYVALAVLFESAGVRFAGHDAGSVFTFSSSLSL